MEQFFTQKCVTADTSGGAGASRWSNTARCEFVLVQEQDGALGASRAVLAATLEMVCGWLESHWPRYVVV